MIRRWRRFSDRSHCTGSPTRIRGRFTRTEVYVFHSLAIIGNSWVMIANEVQFVERLKNPEKFNGIQRSPFYFLKKPFGFGWYPKELMPSPKDWIAESGNLVFFRQHEKVVTEITSLWVHKLTRIRVVISQRWSGLKKWPRTLRSS